MIVIEFFLILCVASIAAGALGSIVGIGGGLIVIPILTLFLGVDIHYAIGASIVSIIATSSGAAATYVKDRITNLRIGMFLETGTTIGAIIGAAIAAYLSATILRFVIRSEEHTSELQSRPHLVCRLLLDKKNVPS